MQMSYILLLSLCSFKGGSISLLFHSCISFSMDLGLYLINICDAFAHSLITVCPTVVKLYIVVSLALFYLLCLCFVFELEH